MRHLRVWECCALIWGIHACAVRIALQSVDAVGNSEIPHRSQGKGFAMTRRYIVAALASAALAVAGTSFAQDTAPGPRFPDKAAEAEANAKQLLSLMDTDKNGKISKQEWMDFMATEFDRLDKDHSGSLDPHELLKSRVEMHVRYSDQGK